MLSAVVYFSDKGPAEWIGSLAVFLTFMHIQIADRLAEAEEKRGATNLSVECHWKLKWYLISKEACWLAYFVSLGAWSALVGVGVFLLYPAWRHWYRRHYPLGREAQSAGSEQAPGPS